MPASTEPRRSRERRVSDTRSIRPQRSRSQRPNPLAPILECGRREVRIGLAIGLAGSLIAHGAAAAGGLTRLIDLERFARDTQALVLEDLLAEYEVDLQRPEPPPPPPAPEPEAEDPEADKPEPIAKDTSKPAETPVEEKPPEAAQAGRVLTAEADPDAPLDLTGDGFVVGSSDRYVGGVTASRGTADKAVYDRKAKADGVQGGKAAPKPTRRAVATQAPEQDLSKPAMPAVRGQWSCAFPVEADAAQVDFARVVVIVTVGENGQARSVVIQSDPGNGFGAAARRCALQQRYQPGLDRFGKPTVRSTPPVTVTFTR